MPVTCWHQIRGVPRLEQALGLLLQRYTTQPLSAQSDVLGVEPNYTRTTYANHPTVLAVLISHLFVSVAEEVRQFCSPIRYTSVCSPWLPTSCALRRPFFILQRTPTPVQFRCWLACLVFRSSRPGSWLTWIRFPWFYQAPPDKCCDSISKFYDGFRYNLQFIIHILPWDSAHDKASLNKLLNCVRLHFLIAVLNRWSPRHNNGFQSLTPRVHMPDVPS
jgi:hypothetical protein